MGGPIPFTVVRQAGGPPVASNGSTRLTCLDEGGQVKLRRGIRGAFGGPLAERVLPKLNALAGELLKRHDMPAEELAAHLHALQAVCQPAPSQHIEWAYAELDGVRVYTDGVDIIVTRQDLTI